MQSPFLPLAVVLAAPLWGQHQILDTESLAPYFPSPQEVVEKMLEAAHIRPGELVYDLGCGDGRVVITAAQKFKARAVGVEIKDFLVKSTNKRVEAMGLTSSVQIVHGNALKTDLSEADVVTLYLLTRSNELLRPNFEKQLKNGARVVSYEYPIREWTAVRTQEVNVQGISHNIFVYEMPASKGKPKKGK